MPYWILPHGEATARAYVCIPVDDATVCRTPVLEALIASGGTAQLPIGVSICDFVAWLSRKSQGRSHLI